MDLISVNDKKFFTACVVLEEVKKIFPYGKAKVDVPSLLEVENVFTLLRTS